MAERGVRVVEQGDKVEVIYHRPGRLTRFRYQVMRGKVGGWVVVGGVLHGDDECHVATMGAGFLSEDVAMAAMKRYAQLKAEMLRKLPQ